MKKLFILFLFMAGFFAAVLACSAEKVPAPNPCGLSPGDWCPSPPGDPCRRHRDAASCKADPKCEGMPYRGESVVACLWDERGFASNCPTVGCISPHKTQ
jgi:hypothetical protein